MFLRSFSSFGRARRVLSTQYGLAPWAALFLAAGCHAPAAHVAPVSVRTAGFALSATSPVQSSPLYLQARQACKRHDYRMAADRLQTLAQTPGLAPENVAFVQWQREICLRDAGLAPAAPAPSRQRSPIFIAADADCGPRALLLVCRKLGVQANLQSLRRSAGATARGTTMAGLRKAAQTLGLAAEGVQVSREALPDTAMPALAWVNRDHYVALLALSGSGDNATAAIHDPNRAAEETITQEQLLQRSGGVLLLVHR